MSQVRSLVNSVSFATLRERFNWEASVLISLIIAAAWVRLHAIRFGLPNVMHPDEDLLVMPAMSILKTGDLNPIGMEYGTFFIYLLTFLHLLVYLLSVRSGFIDSTEQLQIMTRGTYPAVFPHPEYVLAGRFLSVAFGVTAVVLVYMLGTRLGSKRLGLTAAAISVSVPDLVVHSHYATTDMALTTMCLLGLYLLLRAHDTWEDSGPWPFIGAAFVCGLAASTKYVGAIMVVPLAATVLLNLHSLDDLLSGRVMLGAAAMAAGFLVGTPYALLDLPKFATFIGNNLRVYNRPGYVPQGTTWAWQLKYLFTDRNAALAFPAAVGVVGSLICWGKRGWIINSFALTVLAFCFTTSIRETRSWLPLAPVACIWAALALEMLGSWLAQRLTQPKRLAAVGTLLLLMLLLLATQTTRANRNLISPDVRILVSTWIEANTAPGTTVAFDRFPANLEAAWHPAVLVFGHYQHDLSWYQSQGVEYVVASDVIHSDDRLSAEDMDRFMALTEQMCLAEQITGSFLAAGGREYDIYRMPPCVSTTP